ncbi:MAG: hypothetical protein L0Y68_00875 [Candidatus Dadabacteria bacterium]|nr:hypothetical protein [Candidatus Dadabacteria bacterium]
MRKIFIFSIKVLASVLLVFVLLEIGLRIVPNIIPPKVLINFEPTLREKTARGWLPTYSDTIILNRDDNGPPLRIWKPFTKVTHYDSHVSGGAYNVKTDEIGFCNTPGSYSKAPTFDVITIGDSFTWCHTVGPEDSWTKQLSDLTGLSSYNLGKGNLGLYEYIQVLKQFGINKHPKFVILNVYEGNDLKDADTYFKTKNNYSDVKANSSFNSHTQKSFLENTIGYYSYSFNFVRGYIKYLNAKIFTYLRYNKDLDFRYSIVFSDKSIPFNTENTDKDEVFYARQLLANKVDLNIFNDALENFVKISEQYRFIPIVSYTPSAHTAYAANVSFNDPTLKSILKHYSDAQRDFFESKGKELGYVFIDFTPSLQSAALSNTYQKLLYFRTSLHLTKYGNEIIAKTLSQSLRDPGLFR